LIGFGQSIVFLLCASTSGALGVDIMVGVVKANRITTSWMQSKNLQFYLSITRKQLEEDGRFKCIWSANTCFI